jgi:hypothetical protein
MSSPASKTAVATPYRTAHPTALAATTPRLEWLVDGLFLKAGAGILGGAPKSCKSFFALDLAVSVASATPCAGSFPVPSAAPVVLLSAEDPPAVVVERLEALARGREIDLRTLPLHVIVEHPVRLPDDLERLRATVLSHCPALLLLDPLIRLHRADENSASEMSVILDGLRDLARSCHTAILLVHHSRKATTGGSLGTGLRGSSDLHAFGDSNLYLKRLSQEASLELKVEHRAAAAPPPWKLRLMVGTDGARFQILDHDQVGAEDPNENRVLDLLRASSEPVAGAILRHKLAVRNQTLSQALSRLVAKRRIERRGKSGWAMASTPS